MLKRALRKPAVSHDLTADQQKSLATHWTDRRETDRAWSGQARIDPATIDPVTIGQATIDQALCCLLVGQREP
jgi:hypothetical protein